VTDIKCRKKGCNETVVELHHLVPKYCGGTDTDGRRYLCKKHHDILHNLYSSMVFRFVPDEKRERLRETIKTFALRWIEE